MTVRCGGAATIPMGAAPGASAGPRRDRTGGGCNVSADAGTRGCTRATGTCLPVDAANVAVRCTDAGGSSDAADVEDATDGGDV
jgi:hypothetical protein